MKFPSNYLELNEEANECRRRWKIDEYAPIDIFSIILNKIQNITIAFIDADNNLSGSCLDLKYQKVIFINRKHSLGQQRFTVAHELYHIHSDKKTFITCSNEDIEIQKEKDANQFASCLLLPHGALSNYEHENSILKWDLNNIIKAEQYFQISHKALLGRLLLLEKINNKEYAQFLPNIKKNAIKRGYPLNLYTPFTNKEMVMGNYIKLLTKAWDTKKISKGKRDELLLDAFYGDYCFNKNIDDLNE